MESKDAFISINGVSKHFGTVVAVDSVNITISSGEFFSLLGASGCGKTTLLRVLAGFEAPTAGEVYIDDMPMSQVPPHQRPTNMVFQNYAIFPHLNVRGNIAYGLRKDRLEKAELQRRVDEALSMVKLDGFGDRRSTELSGGQRQRVALARALIKRPKVLLLDEPLGALDKKLREDMQLELRALQQSVGITFIFVTHDQEEALTLSDRIAVMARGQVLQIASPKELYNRPVSIEVADFIGQMNFIDAAVRGIENGHAVIEAAGLGQIKVKAEGDFIREGAKVMAAIRPEKLLLSQEPPRDGQPWIEGKMHNAAYLGDRSHYYVRVEGRDAPIAVAAQEIDPSISQSLHRDAAVWLSWAEDALVLLPAEN